MWWKTKRGKQIDALMDDMEHFKAFMEEIFEEASNVKRKNAMVLRINKKLSSLTQRVIEIESKII